MTEFELIVVRLLWVVASVEVLRLVFWAFFKVRPLFFSRKRKHREVIDDE